jgi:hypothetical protein
VPLQLASVPVNTDAVSCTPIFEIRETQSANATINTFGNTSFNTNHPTYQAQVPSNTNMRDTQYSQPTPGPPFHISNVNSINLNTRNASYMPPQVSAQAGLGSATNQDFTPAGFTFMDDTEMDLSGTGGQDQPSPATISSQSRGGSTSHSSYSPGTNEHNLPYRASPKPGTNSLPLQPTNSFPPFRSTNMETTAPTPNHNTNPPHISYPPTTNSTRNVDTNGGMDMFSTTFSTTGNTGDEAFSHGFLMGNEWEFGQTGLTPPPMSDGNWNQMLESVTMGWDANGAPQNHNEGH